MGDLADAIAELLSGDEVRAEAAAALLPSLGAAALPTLLDLTTSSEVDTRWWATRSLAGFSDPAVVTSLVARLADPDAAVRQCAAVALRLRPSADALPALAQALSDQDALVAWLAADALSAAGPDCLPHLQVALRSDHARARIEAARALAALHHPRATPVLFAALDDPSALVQHWAEQGLEALGAGMVYFSPG